MIDDERQRVLVLRTDMDEVDVEAVDLGRELRERVQPRLARAPVVLRLPVAGELPHRRELHALGLVRDGLLLGPLGGCDASTEIVEGFVGNVDVERADLGGTLDRATHANHRSVAVAVGDWVVLTSTSRRLGAHRAQEPK